MTQEKNYITLTNYLDKIDKVISDNFYQYEWVRCEISNISIVGGHYYIEVIDIDDKGKKTKNQTAIIYNGKKKSTIDKFKNFTGEDLKKGMKVLFKLQVKFSSKFSFSLIVEDIDPHFTLGEMEVKIKQIQQKIESQGFQFLNRNLVSPIHFTNIAVISPEKAAGLADFMAESEILRLNKICNFDYYNATFEGDKAKNSIKNAFAVVNKKIEEGVNYDAVVLIRGGGSKLSLHSLNEYILSVCVCRTKVPVFTGIGHEIDRVILDNYAHYSFDTPSKVIEYITNVLFGNYSKSIDNLNQIEYIVGSTIENSYKVSSLNHQEIQSRVENKILSAKNITKLNIQSINNDIFKVIEFLKNKAKNNLIEIENNTLVSLKNKSNQKENNVTEILNIISKQLLLKKSDFKSNIKEIKNMSIQETLKRGYAIIKSENKVITSIDNLKNLDTITIILEDGKLELKIKQRRK
jgi:exodeoxyribonuclease VII large subunit